MLAIVSVAMGAHLAVIVVRRLSERLMAAKLSSAYSKVRTVASLVASVAIFLLYFGAVGLVLKELGVSLTAYLASASVMGLAIGFGLQGLVQDVIIGLTLVFSDLIDVGEMVEISGQTGIVRRIGMRFTGIENSFGAQVFIPNRTITSVVNYPRGYIRGLVDITLPGEPNVADKMEERVSSFMSSVPERFPGILIAPPSVEGRFKTSSGKEYLRVKFRLWPGRGGPIETIFRQEILQALRDIDPTYMDWMVTVNYEVERKPALWARPRAPQVRR
jgi:small conductance mechanosensitive channel